MWSAVAPWPLIAIHAVLLPEGRVLTYGTDTNGRQTGFFNYDVWDAAAALAPGTGTGLTARYYNDPGTGSKFTTLVRTRVDASVNFDWASGSPIPGVVQTNNFSVRWSGQLQAPVSGNYVFSTVSDDGVRVWVNGVLRINNWTDHAPTTNTSASIALVAGQKYSVVMEYYERGGGAVARLRWAYPGQATQAIPQSRLYP